MPRIKIDNLADFVASLNSKYPKYVYPGTKDYEQLHETIDDLCVFYLDASREQRSQIRILAAERHSTLRGQLLNHIGWTAERVRSSKDGEWVRRGLAAASIEDNREDFRDTFAGLGRLYLAAACVGIECSHYFQEAAELSSAQHGLPPSRGCMKEFLSDFEQSAYFKADVRPMIGKYESPRVRNEILIVLADIWDPLGVKNGRYPPSEYESFIHDIYRLLAKDATDAQITDHLSQTARRRMETEPPATTPAAVRALRAIKLGKDQT
jgi:hypothetical protein